MVAFVESLAPGRVNRMSGTGAEHIIKANDGTYEHTSRIDVGNILVGVGITHFVEDMTQPPGLDNFAAIAADRTKMALRAFRAAKKAEVEAGFRFEFEELDSETYADVIRFVSQGVVELDPATIPPGTFVLSFLDDGGLYSLDRSKSEGAGAWYAFRDGARHWCVGKATEDDFWEAEFPGDDVSILQEIPPWQEFGRIQFGMTMLEGSEGAQPFGKVPAQRLSGEQTEHQFVLRGAVTGVQGLNMDYPIGLRTSIICFPEG